MIRLAAFLGNPGPEYARNRHNAGRMLAERLSFYSSLGWQRKYKGRYAAADGGQVLSAAGFPPEAAGAGPPPELPDRFHFLMPETYMNLSGESIQAAAAFFKIKIEEILVVHDELELPLGTLSLKFAGGLGGHNGLRSTKTCLGAADFWRLRIGIGRPGDREPGAGGPPGSGKGIADWVLSDFTGAETTRLDPVLEAGASLLPRALAWGPAQLLPEWGKRKIAD